MQIELVSPLDLVHGLVPNSGTMSPEVDSSTITNSLAPSAMELPSLLQKTSLCKGTTSLEIHHSSVPVDQIVQNQTSSLVLPPSLPRPILQHQCLFRQISSILVRATP